MKKSILNLKGAQELTKNEQKAVSGGFNQCVNSVCQAGYVCCQSICYPAGSKWLSQCQAI